MKCLIVPDVHGRVFWKNAKNVITDVDKVIFLGDYLDPYNSEGITFEDAVIEFKDILAFKEDYPDKVVLLLGNHDVHYLISDFINSSRLNVWRRMEMHEIFVNNIDKFQLVYKYGKYLFSHAGVYKDWLDSNNLMIEDLFDCKTFLDKHWKTLQDVSYVRGGWNNVGSCVWADIQESLKYHLAPDFIHIVGHTQLKENPYVNKDLYCFDVRRCFILDTETGEINELI